MNGPPNQVEHGNVAALNARRRTRRAKSNGHLRDDEEPAAPDLRPSIRLRGGGLADHAAEAERILAAETLVSPMSGIYARGSLLMRPVRLQRAQETNGIRRAGGSLQLMPTTPDYLRLELTRLARFLKYDKRSEAWLDTDAPESVAKSVLAAVPWPVMPRLSAVVEAPTLRPDGTLLDRPGYDQATGLLFDPNGCTFVPIPTRPTRQAAGAGLASLKEILRDFPLDAASRSVAIAGIITSLTRRSLRSAPLFGFTAPKMASGKTLLATIIAYIATGRAPAMLTQADDAESERKRLLALLLEGAAIAVIDNIERPLASAALNSILTEPMFADRVLGLSRMASVPTNAMFCATGNNLVIGADLSTRALVCALDPRCERPEERRFEVNLHEMVPARRGELVAAALSIPLAYLAAGAPPQNLPPFGRFEDWSRWCRDPLVWLGEADPCATRQRIESRDPVREQLRVLLAAWHAVFDASGQTVATAVQLDTASDATMALREAILAVAQQGREVNTRQLGNFISKHENRIEGGLSFARAGSRQGVAMWAAVPVEEP